MKTLISQLAEAFDNALEADERLLSDNVSIVASTRENTVVLKPAALRNEKLIDSDSFKALSISYPESYTVLDVEAALGLLFPRSIERDYAPIATRILSRSIFEERIAKTLKSD